MTACLQCGNEWEECLCKSSEPKAAEIQTTSATSTCSGTAKFCEGLNREKKLAALQQQQHQSSVSASRHHRRLKTIRRCGSASPGVGVQAHPESRETPQAPQALIRIKTIRTLRSTRSPGPSVGDVVGVQAHPENMKLPQAPQALIRMKTIRTLRPTRSAGPSVGVQVHPENMKPPQAPQALRRNPEYLVTMTKPMRNRMMKKVLTLRTLDDCAQTFIDSLNPS